MNTRIKLKVLRLYNNNIGDLGCYMLSQVLLTNSIKASLEEIDLQKNYITYHGLKNLAVTLALNDKL